MAALLKFLFFSILILWIIRLLAARLLPWILRRFAKKMQEQAFKEFHAQGKRPHQANPHQQQKQSEGKISIEYIAPQPNNNSNRANKAGEFVDFEDIK